MKNLTKYVSLLLIFVIMVGTVRAMGIGYSYYMGYVGGDHYTVNGRTIRDSSGYWYAKTTSYAIASAPVIPFKQLSLRSRIWYNAGYCAIAMIFNQSGSCSNCTQTADLEFPNSGSPTFYVSRHRVKHPTLVNGAGNTPGHFYTMLDEAGDTYIGKYNGQGIWTSCGNPLIPPNDPD